MGCSCSREEGKFDKIDQQHTLPEGHIQTNCNYNYIALALLNANRAASLMVHDICPGQLEQTVADQIIR
uniref:Uncharacterized protein n=1 Tax=Ditylenchus dipsaci TaxID=166011 RepID=A0A915EH87_9BILA